MLTDPEWLWPRIPLQLDSVLEIPPLEDALVVITIVRRRDGAAVAGTDFTAEWAGFMLSPSVTTLILRSGGKSSARRVTRDSRLHPRANRKRVRGIRRPTAREPA